MSTVLEIDDLQVESPEAIVRGVSLSIGSGENLTVLGESGSGKSIMAQAIMGTLPRDVHARGSIAVAGMRVLGAGTRSGAQSAAWGRAMAMLPQEPWLALDPTMRIGRQVAEVSHYLAGRPWTRARAEAARLLHEVGLAHATHRHVHQISGGMAQRAAIACVRCASPMLLIADEPTKGLDATLRDQVADLLRRELAAGKALMTITHDVELARRLGGRIVVMLEGRIVERGPADSILDHPAHAYSRELVAAAPGRWPPMALPRPVAAPVVAAQGVAKGYGAEPLFSDVDLAISRGEIVSVVGPSGCGKTTLGNIVTGLLAPDRGRVVRQPGLRAHAFQKLYQDPPASFAPTRTIGRSLDDLVALHRLSATAVRQSMLELKLAPALLDRLPSQVSGGELQRLALLRILLLEPDFVFADEPTSRLDPLTQKLTIGLLIRQLAQRGGAMMLVTHDADIARSISHRVVDGIFRRLPAD